MSDLTERLTIDAACLRKMMAQADIAGPQTGVRVKSPDLLLESIVEAADRIASLETELQALRKALEAIRDYPPADGRRTEDGYPLEVVYDEYAYRRIVDSYRSVARLASEKRGAGE